MPHYSACDGLKIYYETYGNEKSYPIVLIHPLGGNIKIWQEEIHLILRSGNFRIIAYEIRGHYRSNMGKSDSFTMEDLAADLDKLLNELKIKTCTLIGHSIGGKIAAVYAKHNSAKVNAIIFISGSSIPIPEDALEDSVAIELANTNGMDAVAEYERERTFGKEKAFQDEKEWNYFKEIFTKTSVRGFIAARNALRTMPNDINSILRNANCKLYGIVGDNDDIFMNLKNKMKQEIPKFNLKIIEGEGHWLILHNPVALDKVLEDFLNEINMETTASTFRK
ncbi:MAG TPA: alpha/beta hydrolase [Nitrososphaeraceae archaeon]|nr:alpha/beta hydrolase [Nitrososphaeraceae archaeon]